jgi:hypothetical protein
MKKVKDPSDRLRRVMFEIESMYKQEPYDHWEKERKGAYIEKGKRLIIEYEQELDDFGGLTNYTRPPQNNAWNIHYWLGYAIDYYYFEVYEHP